MSNHECGLLILPVTICTVLLQVPPGLLLIHDISTRRQLARQVFPSGPLHGAVRCYELFMLHVGVLPTHFVLRQGHKLAARMWETTGEANSPITLL